MKNLAEQYFRFPRRLLTSPAWSVLNIHERRAFDRIMEEHQSKSGFVNGGLVITKRDFLLYGIDTPHIAPSLRVLCALGIIECTRNMGGSRSGRTPNMWKPTFLPSTPTANDASHAYLDVKTEGEAKDIAHKLRFSRTRGDGAPPAKQPERPKLRAISLSPASSPKVV
ncbi:hypothetical protein [Bradyrhizobium neotropicale]|uniref:Uncharacterized protein n=1 Tax=Bradyrhizobium neotropicale TaxID=1497615 RepID=A0A176ZB75_9BRAD|nr:hypothetical protein [Bradyrhizobium neotropicale]OAF17848.1 hypothetical protein AXW67_06930 [Bradyrhizobium neotropicale]